MSLPFGLKIAGLDGANNLINTGWPTKIITMLDPDVQVRKIFGRHIEQFHDSEQPSDTVVLATRENVDRILAFSKTFDAYDRVLIHCYGGFRRSPTTACAVLVQHGFTPEAAMEAVVAIRPVTTPNLHLASLYDEALGCGGAFLRVAEARIAKITVPRP